ncbi:MAG TPA: DNA polymerase III subunit delta [Candidatus Moranbacteria bacterium]|nr:DNA polymerase III subunit delta [Candidatus Moranbacteria bacterium]
MIIFLYGEDSFRSHIKLLEIKDKYLESDKSGSGLSSFECDEKVLPDKIINSLETANLLAPKRLVIIKRIISSFLEADQKKMLDFLKKHEKRLLENKDLVAVFWEENQPKKNNAIYKFLEKNAKKQNFEKLTGAKLDSWIIGKIKKINPGASISKAALEKLILYVGSDAAILDKELQKLADYSGENMIIENDVDALVSANLDSNIFATVDAIGANNKKEALLLLHRHLKKGDDPFYIFSMFLYQFRNLLKIADLKESGISSEYEISKITKMHPFVIRKSLGQIRNFSFSKLKEIYQKLGSVDTEIKTGKIDIKLALDKLVAEL